MWTASCCPSVRVNSNGSLSRAPAAIETVFISFSIFPSLTNDYRQDDVKGNTRRRSRLELLFSDGFQKNGNRKGINLVACQIEPRQRLQAKENSFWKTGQLVEAQMQELKRFQACKNSVRKAGQSVSIQIQPLKHLKTCEYPDRKTGQLVVTQVQAMKPRKVGEDSLRKIR